MNTCLLLKNAAIGFRVSLTAAAMFISVGAAAQAPQLAKLAEGYRCTEGKDLVEVTAFGTGMLRLAVRPGGILDERTPVLDPALQETPASGIALSGDVNEARIQTDVFTTRFSCASHVLTVSGRDGKELVSIPDLVKNAVEQQVMFHRALSDPIYGITGIDRNVVGAVLEHPNGAKVSAGKQGKGGGPFFFTRKFGVLVDSIDGNFTVTGKDVRFEHDSRKELEFFLLVGAPLDSIRGLANLTGHSPMPPKWTLGFLNSQWGVDEAEMRALVEHYRASHIPLDAFVLDYDWKAWGEDNYGEWRWNSTSGPGNPHPNKFPNGASGALGRDMSAKGVHLAGILKPRILLYKEGTTTYLDAAAYAQTHNFWYPGLGSMMDYTTNRPTANLDFSIPAERTWFWKHLEGAFDAGMVGWWNDEADEVGLADKTSVLLSSLEHFNMGRALYEGQRSHSNTRVWSLNRNFYLGAQRYGFAEWSGDVKTGVESMAQQPVRMLATLNLGEPHWSMDTGGFRGNPTSEEYARWVEFAAFTPICRVHARLNQKRQPWVFGEVAESAAKKALQLRYSLMPYIYSAERTSFETGIGVARPLEWIFPEDEIAARQTDEWMFGDALLVAPVLEMKATVRKVYLPAGSWTEYATGRTWIGGQTISIATDPKGWSDIPLFVREGSVLATEPSGDDTDAMHPEEITLDVFASPQRASTWSMYDDDGATYGYEKGSYFKQNLTAGWEKSIFRLVTAAPEGTFKTSVNSYRVRLHGVNANELRWRGHALAKGKALAADAASTPSWSETRDRFGDVIEIRMKAGIGESLELSK